MAKELIPVDPKALKPPMNVKLVTDSVGLEEVGAFLSGIDTFCLDVETNVAKSFVDRTVRTVQIGNRNAQYVVDLLAFAGSSAALVSGQGKCQTSSWARPVVDIIAPALTSSKWLKVGANLEFEYIAFKWCFGVKIRSLYDCYQAEKVLYCGSVPFYQEGFWGLDDMVGRYTGLRMSKDLQKSFDLSSPLTEEQAMYAALDARLPLAVRVGQLPEIKKAGLEHTVQIENDAVPAFGDMHVNGFYLDRESWLATVADVKTKHIENVKVLDTYFKPVVGDKNVAPIDDAVLGQYERAWRDEKDRETRAKNRKAYQAASRMLGEWRKAVPTCEGDALINYGSTDQLLAAFTKLGLGTKKLPNTNDKVLAKLASDYPVIKALQDYRETGKKLNMWGEEFLDNINSVTGRVHSRFNQIGAETGRASSTDPNLFNIPKGSAYRHCFKARPGYKIITVDMSGAELRIIAEESGEPVWLDAFNKGWDVHAVGAELMYGVRWKDSALPNCAYYASHKKCKCPGHVELRDKVKAVNFGVAYGMEEHALAGRLMISVFEARKLLHDWRTAFKVAAKYLLDSGNRAKASLEARTIGGRRRMFKRPDWNRCRELAIERFNKEGKDPSRETTRIYHAMYSGIEREGKNMPIQGANADIAKVAMGCGCDKDSGEFMWDVLEPKFGAYLVNFVYDEFVVECPEPVADGCEKFVGDAIKRSGAMFLTKLVMDYEGCVDDKWNK